MKKLKNIFIVTSLVLALCSTYQNVKHSTYNLPCTIIEIDNDTIVAMDNNGNTWQFLGSGYELGESVNLKMFNNYTKNFVYDDKVKDCF